MRRHLLAAATLAAFAAPVPALAQDADEAAFDERDGAGLTEMADSLSDPERQRELAMMLRAMSEVLLDLPIEQQTALRCGVAVAIATEAQRAGNADGKDWPDLLENERGREYFVRTMAKLMDDTGIAREGIALRGRKEAEKLAQDGQLDAVMPACLLMMQASGF